LNPDWFIGIPGPGSLLNNGFLFFFSLLKIASIIPYISQPTGILITAQVIQAMTFSPSQKGHGLKCPVDVQSSYSIPYERESLIFFDLQK